MTNMSDVATRQDIDEVIGIVRDFMTQVSERFDAQDTRMDNIEKRMDDRFDVMDKKYDHLINTIDGFIARIDRYETEQAARDSQFNKLLVWAREVSKKTGIPIVDL